MSPAPLHRHQLAWLTPDGWGRLRDGHWDAVAEACLAHWTKADLPLVITRQSVQAQGEQTISMGLPAPCVFDRQRLAVSVASHHVARFGEFPSVNEVTDLLPLASRRAWTNLCRSIEALGVTARVHGSYGWQRISGLLYVHHDSDIDLTFAVLDVRQADAVVGLLQAGPPSDVRLDGELVFAQGHAVAWREWVLWRSGRAKVALFKHLDGARLVRDMSEIDLARAREALT